MKKYIFKFVNRMIWSIAAVTVYALAFTGDNLALLGLVFKVSLTLVCSIYGVEFLVSEYRNTKN